MKTVLLKTTMKKMRVNNYDGPVLVPVMDDADKIPFGELVADIKKNRNPGNHKRFFAFVSQTFAMQDQFNEPTDADRWYKQLLLMAGQVDEVISPRTGQVGYMIKSISWDKMEEIEFKQVFNSVLNAFIKYYGNDLNDIQINSILEY